MTKSPLSGPCFGRITNIKRGFYNNWVKILLSHSHHNRFNEAPQDILIMSSSMLGQVHILPY